MKLHLPKIENIVLLGGGPLLVSLALWCKSKGVPIYVVTSPRHAEEIVENGSSLSQILDLHSISYLVESDISSVDVLNYLSDLSASFCLSLGAAWIFKAPIIENLFRGRLFNLHGTRLPQNRGGGAFSWQILMGNRLGFCQLHMIDAGVDTGDIVKTSEFLYPASCRTPMDYQRVYVENNLEFILNFIEKIISSESLFHTKKQLDYLSSYWPRLNAEINGWIDWEEDIQSLDKFICAFDEPYEGAKSYLNSKKVHIKNVMADFSDNHFHPFQYGLIYRKGPSWLIVSVKGGSLIIQNITDENGNSIFENVQLGDRLVTPMEKIQSRFARVTYSPKGLNVPE